jgi:hypothetical protein
MEDVELEEQLRLLQEENNGVDFNLHDEEVNKIKTQKNIHKIIQRDIDIALGENTNILHQYPYFSEDGTLLYRIVEQKNGERYVAQKYKDGKFTFGLGKETKRVPYNVPLLQESQRKGCVGSKWRG